MKSTECAFERMKEAFELVAQDEARKVSIVQEIMLKSTDYLRRIIAPVGGQGGVTALQQLPHRGPHSVGLWEKSKQQVVVRDLWRKIRLEATKQARGCTNRRKYRYHLGQNNYSFDALQAYCFGINIKL